LSASTWPPEIPADGAGDPAPIVVPSGAKQIAAAVLVPLFTAGRAQEPHLVLTRRRSDLRSHAGEISFPGGRRDEGDSDFVATALREAEEEIALDPAAVEIGGALPPTTTFATGYRIYPFVGLVADPAQLGLEPSPDEVETVLAYSLEILRESYEMRRLVRRGVPIHTPTYEVEGQMIWGATARIVGDLLARLTGGI
jgi:8-oxo-dGTP pyrophosphatase MutT (NUDIX family)